MPQTKRPAWKGGQCFVSHEHRFVYVQVPKAACTSIKAALLPLFPDLHADANTGKGGAAHRAFRKTDHMINKRDLIAGFDSGEYQDYFVFSFVRNPWDRLFSCYNSKIGVKSIPFKRTDYEGRMLYPGMTFREFAEVVCKTPDEYANRHFRSQAPILSGPDGALLTSYVGRFENLAEDFAEVCGRIGVSLELPHLNPSRRGSYRDAYDAELREMVGERYRSDVERFGYSF